MSVRLWCVCVFVCVCVHVHELHLGENLLYLQSVRNAI